ncbi:DUF3301 domain-containing protein [Aliiglaciecola litoralis]|uniref:DUF3301 domain-containing protein n=1 Tax=Aliiglaciecola litoralis TaxID=582857 RepID=A0ABP3WSY8_9ALTE
MEFSLSNIVLFAVIAAIIFQFWRIRAISEQAKVHLDRYCHQHGLQLISIARFKTRLIVYQAKLDWYTQFAFEFSSTGEERYTGVMTMRGLTMADIDLPAYRINETL